MRYRGTKKKPNASSKKRSRTTTARKVKRVSPSEAAFRRGRASGLRSSAARQSRVRHKNS